MTTLNVLSEALRTYEGAIVVISHDRQFLEELDATHVLTVRGGRASLEERSLQEKDWDDPLDSRSDEMLLKDKFATNTITAPAESVKKAETTSSKVVDSPELRKKKLNAPKRIKKIENSLEKHQKEMAKIDEDMLANGRNRSKLLELQVSKEQLQAKIDKLYVEYEELAELVE